jgi:hypothetical protein
MALTASDYYETKESVEAALEVAFTSSGTVLKQALGEWTRPPTQVWRNFVNRGTQRLVLKCTAKVDTE